MEFPFDEIAQLQGTAHYLLGKDLSLSPFVKVTGLLLKKSHQRFFQGMLKKTAVWKVSVNSQKTSLVEFMLTNLSCPIYHLQLY